MSETERDAQFWAVAEPLLQGAGVTRSTMMGFPCLRLHGVFFASCDHRTGDLVVKLDAARVADLIDRNQGEAFAPNGRRFREWVTIPQARQRSWAALLDEALRIAARRTSSSGPPRS